MTTNQKKIIWPIDMEPMLSILRHPKITILFALKFKSLSYFIKVGIIGSFASSLMGFIGVKLASNISLVEVVYSSFLTAILLYFVTIGLMTVFTLFIGAAFKGKGKFKILFRALSLSVVPYIWTLPVLLFWMQLSPQTFFYLSFDDASLIDLLFSLGGAVLLLAASIWSIVIMVHAVAIVHQFSKWKSFFTVLIVFIIAMFVFSVMQMVTV